MFSTQNRGRSLVCARRDNVSASSIIFLCVSTSGAGYSRRSAREDSFRAFFAHLLRDPLLESKLAVHYSNSHVVLNFAVIARVCRKCNSYLAPLFPLRSLFPEVCEKRNAINRRDTRNFKLLSFLALGERITSVNLVEWKSTSLTSGNWRKSVRRDVH